MSITETLSGLLNMKGAEGLWKGSLLFCDGRNQRFYRILMSAMSYQLP
jgi:hypothetical protein